MSLDAALRTKDKALSNVSPLCSYIARITRLLHTIALCAKRRLELILLCERYLVEAGSQVDRRCASAISHRAMDDDGITQPAAVGQYLVSGTSAPGNIGTPWPCHPS